MHPPRSRAAERRGAPKGRQRPLAFMHRCLHFEASFVGIFFASILLSRFRTTDAPSLDPRKVRCSYPPHIHESLDRLHHPRKRKACSVPRVLFHALVYLVCSRDPYKFWIDSHPPPSAAPSQPPPPSMRRRTCNVPRASHHSALEEMQCRSLPPVYSRALYPLVGSDPSCTVPTRIPATGEKASSLPFPGMVVCSHLCFQGPRPVFILRPSPTSLHLRKCTVTPTLLDALPYLCFEAEAQRPDPCVPLQHVPFWRCHQYPDAPQQEKSE